MNINKDFIQYMYKNIQNIKPKDYDLMSIKLTNELSVVLMRDIRTSYLYLALRDDVNKQNIYVLKVIDFLSEFHEYKYSDTDLSFISDIHFNAFKLNKELKNVNKDNYFDLKESYNEDLNVNLDSLQFSIENSDIYPNLHILLTVHLCYSFLYKMSVLFFIEDKIGISNKNLENLLFKIITT